MAALQPECTTADKREEYSAMKMLLPPPKIDVHLRSKMEEKVKSTTAITQIAMDQWNMILCLCLRTMICGYSSIIHMWTRLINSPELKKSHCLLPDLSYSPGN
eukprot:scpid59447/ scgid29389/ 